MSAAEQLALFERRAEGPPNAAAITPKAEALADFLWKALGKPVRLSVTNNLSTMVSFRKQGAGWVVRLHHLFLDAPDEVRTALAHFMCGENRRQASRSIDAFVEAQRAVLLAGKAPRALKARGRYFDLADIFARMNARFFDGRIEARIGWGRGRTRGARRTIRFGVYERDRREIRLHPALDHADVPLYFVEFIVFHEMLHQAVPRTAGKSRAVHHSREFREREKQFPHYQDALRWEKAHLSWLLRQPRR